MTRRPIYLTSRNIVTLDGNVADTFFIDMQSSVQKVNVVNIWPGHLYVCLFSQNSQGGHSFQWPDSCINPQPPNPAPHTHTVQCFIGNWGFVLQAIAPGGWR